MPSAREAEEGRKRGGSRNVNVTANHKNISLISGGKQRALTVKDWQWGKLSQ